MPHKQGHTGAQGVRPVPHALSSSSPRRGPGGGGGTWHGPSRPRGRRGSDNGKGKNADRRSIIVAVIALLVGVAVFCYPMVSNYLHEQNTSHVVAEQASTVSAEDEATLEAARQAAIAYNQKLLDSRTVVTDPFDPNAQRVTDEEYESVLNLAGDGVMGTITIPKIQVQMPIYHGTSDDVLQQGVGHLQETSVPIGGESTHAVLSGHTGLPSAKIFDNLDQLEVGDYFIITVLGEDHAYRVTSTEVVLPDETDSLVIQPGKDLCTLVTCTPYGINTHRLLVHAERCDVPDEWLNKGDAAFPSDYPNPPDKALLPSILIGLLLAALIIGGYALAQHVRKRVAAGKADSGGSASGPGRGAPHVTRAPRSRSGTRPEARSGVRADIRAGTRGGARLGAHSGSHSGGRSDTRTGARFDSHHGTRGRHFRE